MKITSDNFKQGDFIPEALAWGRIGEGGSTVRSTNLNPQLSWTDAPEGTASFVLACLDDDVPTDLAERDASGEIPVSQPRRRFVHWVQPNCPVDVTSIAEGALAEERKTTPGFGAVCINDYRRGRTTAPNDVAAARLLRAKRARATMAPVRRSSTHAGTTTGSWSSRSTPRGSSFLKMRHGRTSTPP